MRASILAFVLFNLIEVGAADKTNQENSERNDIIPVESDDQEMVAAMGEARKKFIKNYLLVLKRDRQLDQPKIDQAMAKVYFQKEEDPEAGEHMWVSQITRKGEKFVGILQSQPGDIEGLNRGDQVTFKIDKLSDWLIVKDGKAFGAYTVQLLRSRMSKSKREEHDSHYPFTFPELKTKKNERGA